MESLITSASKSKGFHLISTVKIQMESKSKKIANFKSKMPSIKTTTPILGGNYYHIFNRGINSQKIFFTEDNYHYFLKLLNKYLVSHISIISFVLLPGHFHLVIKVNDSIKGIPPSDDITGESEVGNYVSEQFRRMFIAYSMAINKQEKRTSSLLDKNFKRIEITEHEYLQYCIFYVHFNPEKHGYTTNFKNYKFSSYLTYLSNKKTQIARQLGLDIFVDLESFVNYHNVWHDEKDDYLLE